MEDIFGFVVLHGCFPVAEGVEGDLVDSWVLEFVGGFFALSCVGCSVSAEVVGAEDFDGFLWDQVYHG